MYKEDEKYDLQKMTRSTEILHVEGKMGKEQIRIVLVYMKTGNDNETKDHNKKIIEEIGQILEEREIQQKATIVLGDFNRHLEHPGNQEENMDGRLIKKMIQEEYLILLNIDRRCEGTYAWQGGEQKSAIDLIMVNQCGYENYEEMEVDEKGEICDLSDHCMVRLSLKIKKKNEKEEMIEKMKITKKKAEEKDKKWMTEQVRKEIKKKKELNRQQRNENREREKMI